MRHSPTPGIAWSAASPNAKTPRQAPMPPAFSQMRRLFPPTHRILGHKTFSWFAAKFLLPCRAQFAPTMSFYDKLKFDSNGLIPAIIQEQKTGRVVMMAWMNRASLRSEEHTSELQSLRHLVCRL